MVTFEVQASPFLLEFRVTLKVVEIEFVLSRVSVHCVCVGVRFGGGRDPKRVRTNSVEDYRRFSPCYARNFMHWLW
jgi:hypothetical protein